MLQSEIAPFAQAHRTAIDEIIATLLPPNRSVFMATLTFTREELEELVRKLEQTKHGFYRFEACMTDEWNQKERYRKAALDCRLNHK